MPFFSSGECSDEDRTRMLNDLYMATMCVAQTSTGNTRHMTPVSITELNVHNVPDFVARKYSRGDGSTRHGFGFDFAPTPKRGLHKARIMVLDFSKWKIRHLVHFICKFYYFDEQQIETPP